MTTTLTPEIETELIIYQGHNPHIDYTRVNSSNIYAIGYHADAESLAIVFKDSKGNPSTEYEYLDVPAVIADSFMAADSIGKWFASKIKGVYPSVKTFDPKHAKPAE